MDGAAAVPFPLEESIGDQPARPAHTVVPVQYSEPALRDPGQPPKEDP